MFAFQHDEGLFISFIYEMSMFAWFLPASIYLLVKWYHYRNHFVIKNRFPRMSISIFIINLIVVIGSVIDSLTAIEEFSIAGQILAAVASGLVFYRTHLVYVRWAITTAYLQNMTKFRSDTDQIAIQAPS